MGVGARSVAQGVCADLTRAWGKCLDSQPEIHSLASRDQAWARACTCNRPAFRDKLK